MNYKELNLEYKLMIKRYDSICDAVKVLEQTNADLIVLTDRLQANQKQIQLRSDIREKIINQELEKMNIRHNEDLEEIKQLRVKLNGD